MEELKKYEEPEMEIKFISFADVIVTSNQTNDGEGPGGTNDNTIDPGTGEYEPL